MIFPVEYEAPEGKNLKLKRFTLEQATKNRKGSRCVALPFI